MALPVFKANNVDYAEDRTKIQEVCGDLFFSCSSKESDASRTSHCSSWKSLKPHPACEALDPLTRTKMATKGKRKMQT